MIPAIKSNTPTDSRANINISKYVSFMKALMSIMFNRVKAMAPIRSIPIMMRKPPMATASLLSFRMRSVNLTTVASSNFDASQSLTLK